MPATDRRRSRVRVQAMVVEGLHGQWERPSAPMWADAAGSGYRRRHRRDAGVVNVLQTGHLAAPARLSVRSALLVHAILVHTAQGPVLIPYTVTRVVCSRAQCRLTTLYVRVQYAYTRRAILNISVPLRYFWLNVFFMQSEKSQKKNNNNNKMLLYSIGSIFMKL